MNTIWASAFVRRIPSMVYPRHHCTEPNQLLPANIARTWGGVGYYWCKWAFLVHSDELSQWGVADLHRPSMTLRTRTGPPRSGRARTSRAITTLQVHGAVPRQEDRARKRER